MIGEKFGKLTVLSEAGKDKHGKKRYLCLCECGKETTTTGTYLRNGDTNSCGCYGKERRRVSRIIHGQSHKTSEYDIWKAMKQRCANQNNIGFQNYGGRGVSVCERWATSFKNFFEDMGPRPTPEHSIDRFPDMDGNYEPANCRWATPEEQTRNKRNNVWIEYQGRKMIMEDWATFFNIDQSTLWERLKTTDFDILYKYYTIRRDGVIGLLETNETFAKEVEEEIMSKLKNQ